MVNLFRILLFFIIKRYFFLQIHILLQKYIVEWQICLKKKKTPIFWHSVWQTPMWRTRGKQLRFEIRRWMNYWWHWIRFLRQYYLHFWFTWYEIFSAFQWWKNFPSQKTLWPIFLGVSQMNPNMNMLHMFRNPIENWKNFKLLKENVSEFLFNAINVHFSPTISFFSFPKRSNLPLGAGASWKMFIDIRNRSIEMLSLHNTPFIWWIKKKKERSWCLSS